MFAQACQEWSPAGVNPGMIEVALDEAGCCGLDLLCGCAGGKPECGDPLRHDTLIACRRCAPFDPGGVHDLFPEDLRVGDAEAGKAAFRECPHEALRPGEAGRLQAERARIIEDYEFLKGCRVQFLLASAEAMIPVSSRDAAKGSGEAQIAETTATLSAPAMTTASALEGLSPPMATSG